MTGRDHRVTEELVPLAEARVLDKVSIYRQEIVVPKSNGEDIFLPGIQKKALRTIKRFAHGIGNNNCRWTGIMLNVHQG
jgi:hypothetical protein